MPTSIIKTFVWSRKIRLFHWVNVLTIFILIMIGSAIYFDDALGLSKDGKVLLKTLHVLTGYIFALNLLIRFVVGFIGTGYERWSQTLPFNSTFKAEVAQLKQNKDKVFAGRSPIGKLMIAVLFVFMTIQMVSGLVLAGTDIYYPPFGQHFAKSIALDKYNLAAIKPYSKKKNNEKAYKAMREFRSPFIDAHKKAFYLLLLLIPLHIAAVIMLERKQKASIVSAMIHGYKYLPKESKANNVRDN